VKIRCNRESLVSPKPQTIHGYNRRMRQHLASLIPTTFLVGGCSLIYNPSNISKPPADANDGGIDAEMTADARIDAPPLADANPSMLVLEDVAPNIIYEGQGQGGSRPALLIIRGHHIVADGLTVSITPSTGLTLGTPTVSMNGDYIALPVSVAINGTSSGTTALMITVEQTGGPAGGAMLSGKLAVQNLPELTAGGTIATSTLAPLYSQVNTNTNVTFTGDATQPAIVRAVSSIKLGNITASGATGTTGADGGGAGGPGGCSGGGGGSTGGCTQNDGGGGGGGGTAGGGGGGFGAPGGSGNGSGGGAAGVMHGTVQVVNYGGAAGMANQSAGGGGGAAAALASQGAGGGGGGTVELTAGGDIMIGTITANGGKGGDAGGLVTGAGGGGGGSGGLVVIRSGAGTIATGAVSAIGGGAGAPGGTGGGGGGMGGPGRVRVDQPTAGSLPSATPSARRGVTFAANTPTIVTTDNPMVTLNGTTDDVIDAYVIDADDVPHFGEPMNLKFGPSGTLMMTPTMLAGYNKLCVTLRPGTRGETLADTCIEIAYLP
jgi:hypothetical protein